jgi:hypothetical protein
MLAIDKARPVESISAILFSADWRAFRREQSDNVAPLYRVTAGLSSQECAGFRSHVLPTAVSISGVVLINFCYRTIRAFLSCHNNSQRCFFTSFSNINHLAERPLRPTMRATQLSKVKTLLTQDQLTTLNEWQQKRQTRMQDRINKLNQPTS